MSTVRIAIVVVGFVLLLPQALLAADWPQYRGPDQTGTSNEKVNLAWPADGPKVVWKVPTKNGFSSFAIAGGEVFTQVNRDLDGKPRELCVALDAASGKELWFADVGAGTYDRGGDTGAPTTVAATAPAPRPRSATARCTSSRRTSCCTASTPQTGKPVWTKDLMKEHAGRNIAWKSAASAVIDGDLVFVAGGGAGQSLLAFNKKTGEVVWKGHDETITHSTPLVTTILGERQVIFFLKKGLLSVSAKDGKALWRFPFAFNVSTAITPVVSGDIVYCSAGYDVGGGACRIVKEGDGFAAKELYKIPGNKEIANHWSTPVCKDGHLYGMFSFKKFGNGPLKCVELATGKVKWEQPGFGAGNVILVGDKIVALTDDGRVVIVEATPAGYKEIARFKAITGKCWSTPALSDGRLYVRSTKEGACLDVSGK